tara:strand:- start:161 stop:526 length:366 start_codon:yes stop_codon:yes gene_type:complete
MIQVLYELDDCIEKKLPKNKSVYYRIQVKKKNQTEKLNIIVGESVIPDIAVEWDVINISGAFLFKNRVIILELNTDQLKQLEFLFYKTDNTIERTISLDQYGSLICISSYYINEYNLVLEE